MNTVTTLLLGGVGGFCLHALGMKINFKQRTIENKIKVYDSLITQWVKTRNFIYSQHLNPERSNNPWDDNAFNVMYGESQAFIGEAVLVSEDSKLTEDINGLNEKFYRFNWAKDSHEEVDNAMEEIKIQALDLAKRMRKDIKDSTRLDREDIRHIISGFVKLDT